MQTKSLKGRDFISTLEFTKEELESMLELAAVLIRIYAGISSCLKG